MQNDRAMKAFTKTKYGGPEILQFEDVEKSEAKDDHILVKVLANPANPPDWHILRGKLFLPVSLLGYLNQRRKSLELILQGNLSINIVVGRPMKF